MSAGVSEWLHRNVQLKWAVQSRQISDMDQQANGLVLISRFLAILNHCAAPTYLRCSHGSPDSSPIVLYFPHAGLGWWGWTQQAFFSPFFMSVFDTKLSFPLRLLIIQRWEWHTFPRILVLFYVWIHGSLQDTSFQWVRPPTVNISRKPL